MFLLISQAYVSVLPNVSLRCVECSALYPGVEAGQPPRYRCTCGGVLDVETVFCLPRQHTTWRQLFDERASSPPTWPISKNELLLDRSGVWRYRELILPVPEQYIISRPEGNTGLYPVGSENAGPGRAGQRHDRGRHHGKPARCPHGRLRLNRQHLSIVSLVCSTGWHAQYCLLTGRQCRSRQVSSIPGLWSDDDTDQRRF